MDLSQIQQLYNAGKQWTSQLEKINAELGIWARVKCDSKIRDGTWSDVLIKAQSGSRKDRDDAEKYAETLCCELLKSCDTQLNEEPGGTNREPLRAKIYQNQERFKGCPLKLVETIVNCLKQEEFLWKDYQDYQESQICDMQVGSSETDVKAGIASPVVHSTIDTSALSSITSGTTGSAEFIQSSTANLKLKIARLKGDVDKVVEALEKVEISETNYRTDIPHIDAQLHQLTGQIPVRDKNDEKCLHEQLDMLEKEKLRLKDELKKCRQDFLKVVGETCRKIHDVIPQLESEIITWKEKQKMNYIKLAPKPTDELTELSKQCADVGDTMFSLLQTLLRCTRKNPLYWTEDFGNPMELNVLAKTIEKYRVFVEAQLKYLIQRSVVETVQPPNIIQVTSAKSSPGTSKSFQAIIRVLALEKMPLPISADITAELVLESKLNGETSTKTITLELHNGRATLEKKKSGVYDFVSASFDSLQVRKFTRPKRARKKTASGPDQLFVCEQKFRLVFKGVFNIPNYLGDVNLRAVSLPVTITTNSSQESDCTAALLWQCWNTSADNNSGPYHWPERVPWPDVSAMLNKKMEEDTGRGLPEEQLLYLADKLNGGPPNDGNYADLTITWNQFAKEKMEGKDFTFWKWFHASVNILEDHMKAEWNDGRIYGFISKKRARELLGSCGAGVFLLRIGESYVSDSGPKITGAVSPVVVRLRSKNGKKKVDYIEPYTLRELELHGTVGQILAHTDADIKYLYPDMIPREEAFKNYKVSKESRKPSQNDGYSNYIGRTIHFKLDLLTITDDTPDDEDEDCTEDDMTISEGQGSGSWMTYADTMTPMSDVTSSVFSPDPSDRNPTPFSPDTRSIGSPQQQQHIQQQHIQQQQKPAASNGNQLPLLTQLLNKAPAPPPMEYGIFSDNNGCFTADGNCLTASAVTSSDGIDPQLLIPVCNLDQNEPGGYQALSNQNDELTNGEGLILLNNVDQQALLERLLPEFECDSWEVLNPTFDPLSPPME